MRHGTSAGVPQAYDEQPLPARQPLDPSHMKTLSVVSESSILDGARRFYIHSVGDDARACASSHVSKEVPSKPLAGLIPLVPTSDGEQPGGNEARFTKPTSKHRDQ